jgi:L-amino acid N-acyltransferase YncA
VSVINEDIFYWIKKFYPTAKHRVEGNYSSITVLIPEIKLGIKLIDITQNHELSALPKFKKDNLNNTLTAYNNGIRLITIFSDEWEYRNSQVKNFLKSAMGVYEHRVYARKCEIKEVSKKETYDFLEKTHIQGKTNVDISFGIYFKDDLLGIMTGSKHHRQGYGSTLVLNRLAFKDDVQVVGGSSKLLKALIEYGKTNKYRELISWSDSRISQGNVYEKLGFELTEELPPDYSYVDNNQNKRQSKQANKKKCLIKKGAIGDMTMTERNLALTLNLHRIYDCGKKRWTILL